MAEQPTTTTSRRGAIFDYVTRIDPALSTFGWKIVALAHLAIVLPLIGMAFPHAVPVKWEWIAAAVGLVVLIGALNVIWFTRMVRSDGYQSPPMPFVLTEILLATAAAGALCYAVGGAAGIYRPVIFVPTLLMAMIGNRWVILVSWVMATASVTLSAAASGVNATEIAPLMFTYGVVWGITAIMVHLLALAALHSDDQVLGLAELAGVAARTNELEEGIEAALPVIVDLADAKRAVAVRVVADGEVMGGSHRFDTIATWPVGIDAVDPPLVVDIDEARARNGVALRGKRALLLAEGAEGDVVAIVLEGIAQGSIDQLMTRFNLERMVMQVDVLVNRSRYVSRLADLGRTDGLTGLANRRTLFDHLDDAFVAARRRSEPLTVVMTDLDHFKAYNDSFGHLAGDDLLRNFATQLRDRVRSIDLVSRYGGEEFVMILPDTDDVGAQALLDKLHRQLRDLPELSGVTFSGGIAVWDGSEGPDSVIGRADRAMYVAKTTGRDRTVLDEPSG